MGSCVLFSLSVRRGIMSGKGVFELDIATIFGCVSIVCNCIVTIFYAYLSYKREKKPPKDIIWETALQLTKDTGAYRDADEFARNYEKLRAFRDNGCTLEGQDTIEMMINAARKRDE